ncbi:hypothetical protein NJB18091_50610 [Mycobacterium marinum]|nr:hypothetical protein NJB18091_50610 [Mycobacterium marinum]
MGQLDTQLEQLVGDPRTVAILDTAGENLSSGDHDARTCAHRHEPTHRPIRRRKCLLGKSINAELGRYGRGRAFGAQHLQVI